MRIEVDGLVHVWPNGVRALDGISLRVEPGERVALLGPNGAGKSTLLKHWNGLLRPSHGTLRLDGVDSLELRPSQLAARVGYLFQHPDHQLFGRTVSDEVGYGAHCLGVRGDALQARKAAALEAVGLSQHARTNPFDLDYSQRKLLALAAVLAMDTPVLALDEPTANLDAASVAQVDAVLRARPAATVVCITHDLDWACETFDRFVVMTAGRVVDDGPAAVLGDRPSIPYLARGLGWSADVVRFEQFLSAWRGA